MSLGVVNGDGRGVRGEGDGGGGGVMLQRKLYGEDSSLHECSTDTCCNCNASSSSQRNQQQQQHVSYQRSAVPSYLASSQHRTSSRNNTSSQHSSSQNNAASLHVRNQHQQPKHGAGIGISRAKIKTIKLTLTVVVCYMLCWTPFFVAQLWAAYDENVPYDSKCLLTDVSSV